MSIYGVDVAAITDLPEVEELVSEDENVAYALARRLAEPSGAMQEIGDTEPYDTIDIREWMGKRNDAGERKQLERQASQVLAQDERVLSVDVTATVSSGELVLSVEGEGRDGPFAFVVSTDGLTIALLRGG